MKDRKPINDGGTTDQKGGKGGQKWVALQTIDFDEAETQEDKHTKAEQSIAEV